MKKSKISKILLLGASALLLASITACGDDKSNQPAEGNNNVDTGTETTPSTNNGGNQENTSGTGEGQSGQGQNQGQGQEQTTGGENQEQSGQGESQQGGEGQSGQGEGQGQQGQENQNNDPEPASDSTVSQDVITAVSGYTEGATLTFNVTSTNLDKAFVSYSKDNGTTWTKIDDELIRFDSNTNKARADILGLKAGSYKVKADNGVNYSIKDVTVTKDDRSGYAHFNNTKGIGAYNNDGTLKSNAIVVYVNDANKNTVKATVNGTEQTGLVNIIKAATNANESLDIRILGEIQTQQWNYKAHGTGNTSTRLENMNTAFSAVDWNETTENELKNPGTARSSNYYKISEPDIIKYGINSMSDDIAKGITHLDGLTNNVLLEINGNHEYDSYYNELDVRYGNNITVEGVGTDAKIFQWGFCFNMCNSIEVKNIEFSDYTEDAVGIQGSNNDVTLYSDYWIHNCTFNSGKNNWDVSYENDKKEGDGSTDFKSAHDLTISYCRYNGTHKTALIGSSATSYQYNVTFHHNFYNACGSRLPFTRNTNFHIYNCYYKGSTGTNMQIQSKAYAFIEGCYFENTNKTFTTSDGGVIKLYNNTVNSTSSTTGTNINYVTSRTETVVNTCKADKTTDFSSFDTNKALFYYDDTNNVSKVDLMLQSTEVNTYIPTVAGAGLLATIDYSKNYTETNGGYVDTTIVATYNESANAPTSAGLYYTVLNDTGAPLAEANVTSSTVVKEKDGKIYITDTSDVATTIGYYMLEDSKKYSTGTHTYSFNINLNGVGAKWQFIRILDGNGNEYLNIGTGSVSKDTKMYYYLNGGDAVSISNTSYETNKSYTITLTVNYDTNTATLSVGTYQVQISSFNIDSISGIKFFTAKAATDRSITVDSVTVE